MTSTERLFVAIPIPGEVRHAVDDWRAGLDLPGRLVPAENFHITLRFIGDADQVGKERVMAALSEAELGDAFNIHVGGFGAFPKLSKATVGWASLEDSQGELVELADAIDEAVAEAGFGYEDRPFHPHLSVVRIRPQRDLRTVDTARRVGAKIQVREIVLYRSRFAGRGVSYDPLEKWELYPVSIG